MPDGFVPVLTVAETALLAVLTTLTLLPLAFMT